MIITIEPCCANKHWKKVLAELELKKTVLIEGYGDMTLNELLPVALGRCQEAEVIITAPLMPEELCRTIGTLLYHTWALPDGGNINKIAHMRVITDARASKSPAVMEWAKRYGGQVELASCQQNDTMVLVTDSNSADDMAIVGPVNVQPCGQWTTMVTRDPVLMAELCAEQLARFEAWKI